METIIDPDGNACAILFDGDLDIQDAGELKQMLIGLKNKYSSVSISLEQVSSIDITCIQVICAANQSFEKAGKTLKKKHWNRMVKERLIHLGFYNSQGHANGPCSLCFWKGEVVK